MISLDCKIQMVQDVFYHLATRKLLYSGTEAGHRLGIGRSAASHAVWRGAALLAEPPGVIEKIFS